MRQRLRLRPRLEKAMRDSFTPLVRLATPLFYRHSARCSGSPPEEKSLPPFLQASGAPIHGQDCKEGGNNKDQRRGSYGCTHHRVFKVNDLCHDRKQHPAGKETGNQTNRQSDQREPDRLTVHNALDPPVWKFQSSAADRIDEHPASQKYQRYCRLAGIRTRQTSG